MIQRKQTLYMLVAVVCMAIFTFAKMFTFNAAGSSMTLYTYGYSIQEMGAEPVSQLLNLRAVCMVLLTVISTVLMAVNIFLFKKRELQLSLLMSQYALLAVVLGTVLFLAGFLGELINRGSSDRNNYKIDKTI